MVGSASSRHFASQGCDVVGIDNDMRRLFFGDDASTRWNLEAVARDLGSRFTHADCDIRDNAALDRVFSRYGTSIALVIHTAAQPSHDWAARAPDVDFAVNATGTLNVLEAARQYCRDAPFIFTSTNKVYGDAPNTLPLAEKQMRWEIDPGHRYASGIDESMSIDQSLHSVFGASKAAADLMVQEYGRYFGMKTVCFRGGCLTGPGHSGAALHGFLSYLLKCCVTRHPYQVLGYKGKQVRDNLHSSDLMGAFDQFYRAPKCGVVYNMGGGRKSNCSLAEAIELCQQISGETLEWSYREDSRVGDHIWYISDTRRFQRDYPGWRQRFDIPAILKDIYDKNADRWKAEAVGGVA